MYVEPCRAPKTVTGTRYQTVTGSRYQTVTGTRYQTVTGSRYQTVTGTRYQTVTGTRYQTVTGTRYQIVTGTRYQTVTGTRYQTVTGTRYQTVTGTRDCPQDSLTPVQERVPGGLSWKETEESAAQQPDGVSSSVSDAQHNKDDEAESLQPDRSGPEDSVGHDDEDESAQVQKAEAEFIETAGDDRSPETGVEARDEDEDDDEGGFTGELGESSENDGVLSREDAEDLVTDNDDSDQDNSRSDHSSEAPAVIGARTSQTLKLSRR
ncbi:prostatic spermine-binding protein-like [Salarias fasciatus]|uniref:prostatic spermine-binding protein-like n=1 Tax=Salarias fasciatus TaxID=181472 RepID=UPI0011765384|nr:prostatic spermine-binding protein-like [Salarias fasciatus]